MSSFLGESAHICECMGCSRYHTGCDADSLIIFPAILLLMSLIPGFFMKIARLFSVHRKEQKLCLL